MQNELSFGKLLERGKMVFCCTNFSSILEKSFIYFTATKPQDSRLHMVWKDLLPRKRYFVNKQKCQEAEYSMPYSVQRHAFIIAETVSRIMSFM